MKKKHSKEMNAYSTGYEHCGDVAGAWIGGIPIRAREASPQKRYKEAAGERSNETLLQAHLKTTCDHALSQLKRADQASDDLLGLTRLAREVVSALICTQESAERARIQRQIVSILTHDRANWQHKEALCDALVDGRAPLWDEVREALKGLLGSEHKLLILSALSPLLLEASDARGELARLRERMRPERRELGAKLVERILTMREAAR